MGPVLICDKSTLQALSPDELSALRRYYSLNIPPVLLIEILGDLKKDKDADVARREVRMLADKILPACSSVNADFRVLIKGEFDGHKIEMQGRPVLIGAKEISNPNGKKGMIFRESNEDKALLRWQQGHFKAADELMAEAWRLSTLSIDLEALRCQLRGAYSGRLNLNSLSATSEYVDKMLLTVSPQALLLWFVRDLQLFPGKEAKAIHPFQNITHGELPAALPYTTYCMRAALIFHFALAFGLVSTRPTTRVDLEYFYYVPFCNAFSSGDKFHQKLAPIVLGSGTFISRVELKSDLGRLASRWNGLTEEQQIAESRNGVPREDQQSVTSRLWDKTMAPGFRNLRKTREIPPEVSAKMLAEFQEMMKSRGSTDKPASGSLDDCDFLIMEHSVRWNGPCICGSQKAFGDCCGKGIPKPGST
jgi:hypothetical protein